jgi:hypothetical protein
MQRIAQNDASVSLASGRRGFLRNAGLAVAGAGALAVTGLPALAASRRHGTAVPHNDDIAVLQGALALEHEGIAAYMLAGGTGLLTPDVLKIALTFLGHHKGHRDALADIIQKAGASPVQPKSDAEYTAELKLGDLKTQTDVIVFAAGLEKGAANAYVGQLAALTDHKLARLFAQLSTDEAVHWAVLDGALGHAVPAAPFLFG